MDLVEVVALLDGPEDVEIDRSMIEELFERAPPPTDPYATAPYVPAIAPREGDGHLAERLATGGATSAAIAVELLQRCRRIHFDDAVATVEPSLRVLAVGDSWVQFPFVVDDMATWLARKEDIAVQSYGALDARAARLNGDTALADLIVRLAPDVVLVSLGGNDLLAPSTVQTLLTTIDDASPAEDTAMRDKAARLATGPAADLRKLVEWIAVLSSDSAIIAHGYDYPFAKRNGTLIGMFDRHGVEPRRGRQLVHALFDAFNDLLADIAAQVPPLSYVDLRAVSRGDSTRDHANQWFDGFHPTSTGFGRLAERLYREISSKEIARMPEERDERTLSAPGYDIVDVETPPTAEQDAVAEAATDREPATSSFDERRRMAQSIIDFEARRDAQGRLQVYYLPSGDGGGRFEVAGINERYHRDVCLQLVELIENNRHAEAERLAVDYIASYTDVVDRWCSVSAIECYLRDSTFNRGAGGAAWIVQRAVGVNTDMVVGPVTRAAIARREADPRALLDDLRQSREVYERRKVGRDESSVFWRGLVNRWNKAKDVALTFLPAADRATPPERPAHPVDDAGAPGFGDRVLNCEASPNVQDDWGPGDAEAAGTLRAARIPESVDLRRDWWAIGDQGLTGSCVGWATADSVLRWHFVKAGRIDETQRLSIRFSWIAAKETDEFNRRPTTFIEEAGTSLKAALDVARKLGAVQDDVLPFDRDRVYSGTEKSFYARAAQYRILSYINLGSDLRGWRRWLYEGGPILVRLDVDDAFLRARHTYGRLERYDPASAHGGHAVALVGYTADGFIVRNSWSTTWGDNGFAYATEAYARVAFTEAYGVTV